MDSGLGLRPPRNDSEGVIPGRSVREREGIHSASPDRGSPSLATLAGDDIPPYVITGLVPVIPIQKALSLTSHYRDGRDRPGHDGEVLASLHDRSHRNETIANRQAYLRVSVALNSGLLLRLWKTTQ